MINTHFSVAQKKFDFMRFIIRNTKRHLSQQKNKNDAVIHFIHNAYQIFKAHQHSVFSCNLLYAPMVCLGYDVVLTMFCSSIFYDLSLLP